MSYFDSGQIDFDMDSQWWCTVHHSKKGAIALHSHVFAFHIGVSGRLDGRSYGHVIKKFFTSTAAITDVRHSTASLQFNVRMWWMLLSITTPAWFQFVEPNLKYTVPGKILPELFYSCTCYEDLPSLSAAAPCSSSWLIHLQCSNKKNSDLVRIWNHNHSNVYYNIVGLLQDHPKKAFKTKWHGHCHRDEQTWWSQFNVRFSISGSTRPNLQVALTHVRQIYSQHSFGLPLGMNGIHRMQSGHARMNLSVKASIMYLPICNAPLPFWSMESRINTTMALR